MTKPRFTPSLKWVADASGLMTAEAQRILRALLDISWNRTGLETSKVVTGTAGTTDNLAKWNADGDLVDGGSSDIVSRWTPASASAPASLDFREDTDNGTNRVRLTAPSSLTGDRIVTLPDADMSFSAAFAAFLNNPSSANFAALLSDESGTAGTVPFQSSGSWTPGLTFGGGATGLTYASRSGFYIQTGLGLFLFGSIALSAKGSSTGAARLTGFPFAVSAIAGNIGYYTGMASITALSFLSNNGGGNTTADILVGAATAVGQATDANFTNSTVLIFTALFR